MLPNIVGNIGGAEKTGWLTHYHSYYFPILSFSAAVGFVNIYNKFIKNDAVHTFSRKGAIVVVVMVSIFVVHYKLVTEKTGMSPFASMKVAAGNLRDRLSVHPTGYAIRNNSVAMFRQGATVATDELGMALLHDHVSVSFFPVGAEEADYLFLPCQLVSDVPSATVNTLYSPFWLSEKGFDANSVEKIASIGYCRLTRIGRTGRLTSTAK
jgi:hypothetical protein